jgi:hypothetical protein
MSMSDPIADFLTRIRNGQLSGKPEVAIPASRIKLALAKVLKDEGYIEDFAIDGEAAKPTVKVRLKYYQGRPGHRSPRAREPSRACASTGEGTSCRRSCAAWRARSSRHRKGVMTDRRRPCVRTTAAKFSASWSKRHGRNDTGRT